MRKQKQNAEQNSRQARFLQEKQFIWTTANVNFVCSFCPRAFSFTHTHTHLNIECRQRRCKDRFLDLCPIAEIYMTKLYYHKNSNNNYITIPSIYRSHSTLVFLECTLNIQQKLKIAQKQFAIIILFCIFLYGNSVFAVVFLILIHTHRLYKNKM